MAIETGGPAFPQHGWSSNKDTLEMMKGQGGMTLRQWYAGKALEGLAHGILIDNRVEAYLVKTGLKINELPAFLADLCFDTADEMIARSKR